ncbi:hypothetical protein SUGI_0890660 [Cryptomeria japonica]|nr:hypothetical protein SUGI_0890660 [Cryptomeria japonica]
MEHSDKKQCETEQLNHENQNDRHAEESQGCEHVLQNLVKWRILDVDWDDQEREQKAIIARFIRPKMSRKTIHDWVDSNWGKHIVIKFIPKGFFVAIFIEESERNHILEKENWFMGHLPLYIQPWTPKFDCNPLAMYEEPVWIRLFNLPIEYYSDLSLEKIGRTLGTLLEIDEEIIDNDLYTYARMKITVVKTIPRSITILSSDGEWDQQVEVEKDIRACSKCGCKFHLSERCRMFVRSNFTRPPRRPKQIWRKKME